jgi:hypothetical protein
MFQRRKGLSLSEVLSKFVQGHDSLINLNEVIENVEQSIRYVWYDPPPLYLWVGRLSWHKKGESCIKLSPSTSAQDCYEWMRIQKALISQVMILYGVYPFNSLLTIRSRNNWTAYERIRAGLCPIQSACIQYERTPKYKTLIDEDKVSSIGHIDGPRIRIIENYVMLYKRYIHSLISLTMKTIKCSARKFKLISSPS